ncbi:mevalonate kinase [Nocardia sp. alder85J]|uniref:mevalonate kinase n=1 Tax=Nocardia sp. alder85J TaxID=2862949 RepID=UPI001CD2DBB3|nr:mevalonate kinase [Nocardia sp. alder85J]MCX4095781.1 mevalonate kinase [Nocardia sp. alder85J]
MSIRRNHGGPHIPNSGALEPDQDGEAGTGIGRAHAKAILIGEHTVVYGLPALAFPLPDLAVEAVARLTATTEVSRDPVEWRTHAGEYRFICGPDSALEQCRSGPMASLLTAMHRWRFETSAVEVRIHSTVPPARGLGFSAACATAVVRALADLLGAPLDDNSLYELVQVGERIAHGNASGVDAAAVVSPTPIRFEAATSRPLHIEHDLTLVIADSGGAGSTEQSVALVRSVLGHSTDSAGRHLTRAAAIIEAAQTSLMTGRLSELGERLTDFQSLLSELGVSTAAIDRIVHAAVEAGAHGAKLTGGGLGGCVLALTEPVCAQQVALAMSAAGASATWTVSTKDWFR